MTKYLIIPDIHNKYTIAEYIIDRVRADKIVLLGDFFDSSADSVEMVNQTAQWLVSSLKQENRVHLLGNHELLYLSNSTKFHYGGYSEFKDVIINATMKTEWSKLKLYYWMDDWLITHAGLSKTYFDMFSKNLGVKAFLKQCENDLQNLDDFTKNRVAFYSGQARGGKYPCGGILWCDYWEEFKDIPKLKQIFGHSYIYEPRIMWKDKLQSVHLCLDSNLKYYATYDDGILTVHETGKLMHL